MTLLARFWTDRRGVSALEYALLAALISIVATGAIKGVGTALITTFQEISDTITSAH